MNVFIIHISSLPCVSVACSQFCGLPINSISISFTHQDPRWGLTTDTFLVPQWGGLIIYNPPEVGNRTNEGGTRVRVRMDHLMPAFIEQLKMLLGVPPNVRGCFGMMSY